MVLAFALMGAGCQDVIVTPFPPGLEPFDDDAMASEIDAPRVEALVTQAEDDDVNSLWARGYIFAPPAAVWAAVQTREAIVARCQTTSRTFIEDPSPVYAIDFDVRYFVDDLLDVEWTDEWRGDLVTGTTAKPGIAMLKHQKIEGSDFIALSEGTIKLLATDDPDVTELQFVEHLSALTADSQQLVDGANDTFAAILAVVRGAPIPDC